MFLLGEVLLAHGGAGAEAYRWFEAAGARGHRGARQRVMDLVATEDGGYEALQRQYAAVAGRKGALWQE